MRLKIWRIWNMTPQDLQELAQKPNVCAGDLAIAATLFSALRTGDHCKLEWLFTRLVGKAKEEAPMDEGAMTASQLPTVEEAREMLARDYATLPAPETKVEEL